MTEYPEHEKLLLIKDRSQAIGEFIEFGGYTLAEYGCPGEGHHDIEDLRSPREDRDHDAGECPAPRLFPHRKSINAILARYFGINENQLETEKRRMLDAQRRSNESVQSHDTPDQEEDKDG